MALMVAFSERLSAMSFQLSVLTVIVSVSTVLHIKTYFVKKGEAILMRHYFALVQVC